MKPPLPVRNARQWAAREGIIPWYAAGAGGAPTYLEGSASVVAPGDDGYIYGGTPEASFNNSGSTMFIGGTGRAFLRLKMPDNLEQGATVDSALVRVVQRYLHDPATTNVRAHTLPGAAAPTTSQEGVDQWSSLTTATVPWSFPESLDNDAPLVSPDISAVIQEVVDSIEYSAGDYIVVWLMPGDGEQRVYTRDWGGGSSFYPRIDLAWRNP